MIFLDGFLTGLILQIAVGPVFFYILNLTLQRSLVDGFLAVSAAVLVDYLYISLAILGVGKLIESEKTKRMLGLLSSAILAVFGGVMIRSGWGFATPLGETQLAANFFNSFFSTLLLTISSPLTVIFWTSLFTTRALEKGYSKKELIPFGFAAGLATLIFLGLAVIGIAYLKLAIPSTLIMALNVGVGVVLILYALIRMVKALKNNADPADQI
jgi:threonine/homoserine/homoserine lactone efflux protein